MSASMDQMEIGNALPTSRPGERQLDAPDTLEAGALLCDRLGIRISPYDEPKRFVQALVQADPRYKGGKDLVRWQLEADQSAWAKDDKEMIMRTADLMRITAPETPFPVGANYDAVIVLGGARQSNLDRTRYAVKNSRERDVTAKQVIVAGSTRLLHEQEKLDVASYAPGAVDEFDLCARAAAIVAREEPEEKPLTIFRVLDKTSGTPAVLEKVIHELKANGSVRTAPTSIDVISKVLFMLIEAKGININYDPSIAAATTQIYQPSTQLDLARVAKEFGIHKTFVAGHPSDPEAIRKRTTATYLSEVLRTLRAATLSIHHRRQFGDE